ncbi:uncharacterized protein LOC105787272 [Gossypium raimondii]|nr:uncharacterized protein LOC105787272 [Gossypium raimondii]
MDCLFSGFRKRNIKTEHTNCNNHPRAAILLCKIPITISINSPPPPQVQKKCHTKYFHCLRRAMCKPNNYGVVLKKRLKGLLKFISGKALQITTKMMREGHLVVIAVQGKEPKRFLIKLDHLYNPDVLKLLKQAEEEFGFSREGVLELPCQPHELQRILSNIKALP